MEEESLPPDLEFWRAEHQAYRPTHEDAIFLWTQVPIFSELTKPLFEIAERIDAREARVADLEAKLAHAESRLKQHEQGTDAVLELVTFGKVT